MTYTEPKVTIDLAEYNELRIKAMPKDDDLLYRAVIAEFYNSGGNLNKMLTELTKQNIGLFIERGSLAPYEKITADMVNIGIVRNQISKMNITLMTMAQGNIRALHRTIENFKQKGVINEVIFGDMLIFDDDREKLYELQKEYNAEEKFMRIVPMDFNFTFKYGFAATLNRLASFATNDMVLYMNVS